MPPMCIQLSLYPRGLSLALFSSLEFTHRTVLVFYDLSHSIVVFWAPSVTTLPRLLDLCCSRLGRSRFRGKLPPCLYKKLTTQPNSILPSPRHRSASRVRQPSPALLLGSSYLSPGSTPLIQAAVGHLSQHCSIPGFPIESSLLKGSEDIRVLQYSDTPDPAADVSDSLSRSNGPGISTSTLSAPYAVILLRCHILITPAWKAHLWVLLPPALLARSHIRAEMRS